MLIKTNLHTLCQPVFCKQDLSILFPIVLTICFLSFQLHLFCLLYNIPQRECCSPFLFKCCYYFTCSKQKHFQWQIHLNCTSFRVDVQHCRPLVYDHILLSFNNNILLAILFTQEIHASCGLWPGSFVPNRNYPSCSAEGCPSKSLAFKPGPQY